MDIQARDFLQILELYESPQDAFVKAGEGGDFFRPENLKTMSAMDPLMACAPNDIRFYYRRREDQKEE